MQKSLASLRTGPNERTCEQQEYFPSTHARMPYFLKIKIIKLAVFPKTEVLRKTFIKFFKTNDYQTIAS